MSLTILGTIVILATVVCLIFAPRHLVWILSATAPFMRTGAVTIGDNAIPPFYIVAIPVTLIALMTWMQGQRVKVGALHFLLTFVIWAIVITAVAPTLFAGTLVLDPRGGIDRQVVSPTPLDYTISMLAQLAYLVLAAGVVLYVSQRTDLSPGILTPAIVVGTVLSAARLLPGAPGVIDPIFRSYGAAQFNDTEARHFGIFFEPSYLAAFSIAALTYCLYRVFITHGARRVGLLAVGGLAGMNLVLSATGTAALTAVILLALAIVIYGYRFLTGQMRLHPVSLLLPLVLVLILLVPNPISAGVTNTIVQKIGTSSFASRSTADTFSIGILLDTWGLGSGLGSNRPSSFLTMVLSSVGLLGFILLLTFFASIIKKASKLAEWRPVAVSLLTLLVAKSVAEPDLTPPLMWLSAGAAIYAIKSARVTSSPLEMPSGSAHRNRRREVATPSTTRQPHTH